jgi:hypothetical protein
MATKDVSEMSLQEIRDAAEQAEIAAQEPAEETVYRRVVGGKEFTAASETELGDLIAHAAEELIAERAKNIPAPKTERTADEEFVLAQEFASSPTKAFDKMLLDRTGLSPADFRKQVQVSRDQDNSAAAELFVEQHKEYLANGHNGAVLQSAMQKKGLEGKRITIADIKTVYEECRDAGLLEERPVPLSAGAILGHITPRPRRDAAEEN